MCPRPDRLRLPAVLSVGWHDDQKRQTNAQLQTSTDPTEALRLHNEVTSLTAQLAEVEERWVLLQEEVGEGDI